jgi:hypothetical protein
MTAAACAHGIVVAHVPDPGDHASTHERITLLDFARRLAALRDDDMAGMYEPGRSYGGPLYFVPSSTLTGEQAAALGIRGPGDLFGGVVPHALVGTKAISHPLVAPDAATVPGWCSDFAAHAGDAVLAGHVAFAPGDALRAGERLLAGGPVRLKPVRASGGRGQVTVRNRVELQAALAGADEKEMRAHGLVLEEDLAEVRTFSVGQVQVADLEATYYGFQRLTRSNEGEAVFGGSDLVLVRGGFDALLALRLPGEIRRAVEQARRYDAAVQACFPGFYASRRNYDIALGRNARGQWRSGVLEQSWRVGGATGPEVAALEVFRREPQRRRVRACGFEVFGDSPEPPPHASVHFRGDDPQMGRLSKYTVVQPDDDAG